MCEPMSAEDLKTELAVLRNDIQHIITGLEAIRQELHAWRVDHETRLRRLESDMVKLQGKQEDVEVWIAGFNRLKTGVVLAIIASGLAFAADIILRFMH